MFARWHVADMTLHPLGWSRAAYYDIIADIVQCTRGRARALVDGASMSRLTGIRRSTWI